MQYVFLALDEIEELIKNESKTKLLAYFHTNKHEHLTDEERTTSSGEILPKAQDILYIDYPQYFRYEKGCWKRRGGSRTIKKVDVVGCIWDADPKTYFIIIQNFDFLREEFFLRKLLLHFSGHTSFEDLYLVNGTKAETLHEACSLHNLLADDSGSSYLYFSKLSRSHLRMDGSYARNH